MPQQTCRVDVQCRELFSSKTATEVYVYSKIWELLYLQFFCSTWTKPFVQVDNPRPVQTGLNMSKQAQTCSNMFDYVILFTENKCLCSLKAFLIGCAIPLGIAQQRPLLCNTLCKQLRMPEQRLFLLAVHVSTPEQDPLFSESFFLIGCSWVHREQRPLFSESFSHWLFMCKQTTAHTWTKAFVQSFYYLNKDLCSSMHETTKFDMVYRGSLCMKLLNSI